MSLIEARWIDIRHNDDARGTLTALEGDELPFPVRRIFYMHRVPQGGERGAHAHRYTQQCLIAVAGAFTVDLSDGATHGHLRARRPEPRPLSAGHDLGAPARLPPRHGGAGPVRHGLQSGPRRPKRGTSTCRLVQEMSPTP